MLTKRKEDYGYKEGILIRTLYYMFMNIINIHADIASTPLQVEKVAKMRRRIMDIII